MTLKDARAFRDYIHSKCSVNCTVPLGFGPDGYFPMSILRTGPHYWKSHSEFRQWLAKDIRERRRHVRAYEQMEARRRIRTARNPIELMIDRACGLA